MSNITIKEALTSFGLSEKETKIYLGTLELGTASANEISKKAKLNRSTTYDLLKSLTEKGIVSKSIKGKTTHFNVISPEKLIAQLDEKKLKLKLVLKDLKTIEERVITKPTIKIFEGKKGVNNILEDILQSKEKTDVISTSKVFKIFTYTFPHYISKRKEQNIFARVIQEQSKETTNLKKRDKTEKRETKAIKNFNLNSATFIYGNKIATIKLVKNQIIGTLISDKTLAEDERQKFELLWKQAK